MKAKHWFVFILLGAIWGSSFMWIKIAIQEVGPLTLVPSLAQFCLTAVMDKCTEEKVKEVVRASHLLLVHRFRRSLRLPLPHPCHEVGVGDRLPGNRMDEGVVHVDVDAKWSLSRHV